MKILIIEDEPELRASMATYLAALGPVQAVGTLAAATTALAAVPDMIVLDLALPDGDGLTWLARWQAHLSAKVLVLTANDTEAAELAGLRLAADYVVKPVRLPVLTARLRKLWPSGKLALGPVTVDLTASRVVRGGQPVALTATEWRLLAYLAQNPGRLLSREQLLAALWDTKGSFVNDNTLTVTIKRLREKLERDPAKPRLIRTIRGMGYFVDEQA